MSMYHMSAWCLWRPEERSWVPWDWGYWLVGAATWEWDPGPRKWQSVLLTSETSFQLQNYLSLRKYYHNIIITLDKLFLEVSIQFCLPQAIGFPSSLLPSPCSPPRLSRAIALPPGVGPINRSPSDISSPMHLRSWTLAAFGLTVLLLAYGWESWSVQCFIWVETGGSILVSQLSPNPNQIWPKADTPPYAFDSVSPLSFCIHASL